MFTERAPFGFQKFRREQRGIAVRRGTQPYPAWIVARPYRPEWIGPAPGGGQHGKPRLWSTGAHGTQRRDQFVSQTRGFVSDDPCVNCEAPHRVVAARQG